jgi:hypothetical protein
VVQVVEGAAQGLHCDGPMVLALTVAVSLSAGCLTPASSTKVPGGRHQRFVTEQGPVHVFCPDDVEPQLLVVYVHGYFDTVDDAVAGHGLLEQFSAARVPALFVMIEGPTGPKQPVRWTTFAPLRDELQRVLGRSMPERVMAMGHSGGNRTLREWSREGLVTDLVLLDAFYGDPSAWTTFLATQPNGRVQLVGALTFAKAEAWRQRLPVAQQRRVAQVKAGTDHMGVVTDGVWMPRLLKERAVALSVNGT